MHSSSLPMPVLRSAAPISFPSPATSPKWLQSAPGGCHGERASLPPSLLREELSEQMRNSKTHRIKSLLLSWNGEGNALDFSCS